MAHGYPDFSRLTQIVGSDIMVPMDIQGSMIQVPVDIQAQYVTIDINLKASEITLDINIAATAVTLDVNLKAQDVNINIDITAQSVAIYLDTSWEALQGNDKSFMTGSSNLTYGDDIHIDYVVPSGKTLYIFDAGFSLYPHDVANADQQYHFDAYLLDLTSGITFATVGGNGGASVTLARPGVIPQNHTFRIFMMHTAASAANLRLNSLGYEI